MRAFQLTGDKKYLEGAKKFVDFWMHLQNINPDRFGLRGTFYDQIYKSDSTIEPYYYPDDALGANRGGPGYDASDSDGPMVSLTAWHYYLLSGDEAFLEKYRNGFKLIGDSIIGTMDFTDHLTWGHPKWSFKYLMDVSEVKAGFLALADIFNTLRDSYLATNYKRLADYISESITTWWNEKEGWYHWYKTDILATNETLDWSKWYPDAAEQIWPLLWDVASPEDKESQIVWKNFNKNIPDWPTKDVAWPSVSTVAIKMADYDKAITHIKAILTRQMADATWNTNNKYFTLLNFGIDFDLAGPVHIVKDSMSNNGDVFKVRLQSMLGGKVVITLRLPNLDKDQIFIDKKKTDFSICRGRALLDVEFSESQTKEIVVDFAE